MTHLLTVGLFMMSGYFWTTVYMLFFRSPFYPFYSLYPKKSIEKLVCFSRQCGNCRHLSLSKKGQIKWEKWVEKAMKSDMEKCRKDLDDQGFLVLNEVLDSEELSLYSQLYEDFMSGKLDASSHRHDLGHWVIQILLFFRVFQILLMENNTALWLIRYQMEVQKSSECVSFKLIQCTKSQKNTFPLDQMNVMVESLTAYCSRWTE